MELSGKQPRLLKDLEDIAAYGGKLDARLEHVSEEEGKDFFRLEGWKGTQSEPMDLTYTIGASYLYELQEDGCIGLDLIEGDKYSLQITPRGLDALRK